MGLGKDGCNEDRIESHVDVDTCFKLLSSPMCRHLVRRLADQSDNVAYLDELVESYAEWVAEEVDQERVAIQCHHRHVPALRDAGIVEFDESSGAVRYYPNKRIEQLLDVIAQWNG